LSESGAGMPEQRKEDRIERLEPGSVENPVKNGEAAVKTIAAKSNPDSAAIPDFCLCQ